MPSPANIPPSSQARSAAQNATPAAITPTPTATAASQARLPLRGWSLELARRWNSGTYSLFVVHGNIFDLFPVQDGADTHYVSLKSFLVRRLFPERASVSYTHLTLP